MSNVHISVVTPVYGCKTALFELYSRLKSTLIKISENFEIIFVNDASPDGAWETIVELSEKDNRVKGINFSRNFGQHYAITAGLDYCSGEWVVVMDCDLQDQPEEILKLYNKALEGYDIVFAQRVIRIDNFLKKFFSKIYYTILSYLTETKQDSSIANFGIYNKNVIKSVLSMNEYFRFFPTMVKWVGYYTIAIPVNHAKREYGKTAYSFRKLLHLGINTIFTFSDKPLRLTVKLGLLIVLISFLFTVFILFRYYTGHIIELGWTSLIISIWFLSGVVIFILGIVGLYIGKTFDNVKNRPLYIVKDKINFYEN